MKSFRSHRLNFHNKNKVNLRDNPKLLLNPKLQHNPKLSRSQKLLHNLKW